MKNAIDDKKVPIKNEIEDNKDKVDSVAKEADKVSKQAQLDTDKKKAELDADAEAAKLDIKK